MKIDYSERLKKLPPYLFAEIDRKGKWGRPTFSNLKT